jgi:hypothetical protein
MVKVIDSRVLPLMLLSTPRPCRASGDTEGQILTLNIPIGGSNIEVEGDRPTGGGETCRRCSKSIPRCPLRNGCSRVDLFELRRIRIITEVDYDSCAGGAGEHESCSQDNNGSNQVFSHHGTIILKMLTSGNMVN